MSTVRLVHIVSDGNFSFINGWDDIGCERCGRDVRFKGQPHVIVHKLSNGVILETFERPPPTDSCMGIVICALVVFILIRSIF